MKNSIDTSNIYNNQYVCVPDKERTLIDGNNICYTKVKPDLYNLPDNSYICREILSFESNDCNNCNNLPYSVRNFLMNLPLNWLSKVTPKFSDFGNDILIIDDCNLLDSIKPYITPYYTKRIVYSNKYNYQSYIYTDVNRKECEKISLCDYLKELDNQDNSSFYVASSPFFWYDDVCVHVFDGITLRNFYQIYFKSGLSKEVILRYLSNTEFIYSIDNQMVKEEVERILNKH